MKRLPPDSGIAIGPILFVLAMLGIIASIMSAGSGGSFGSAGVSDRITADVVGQANMIRAKITECQMQYLAMGRTFASAPCENDSFPCSDQTNGTLVSALTCPNDPLTGGGAEQSLWTGPRVAMLPQPTAGFEPWKYINAGDAGGRCIWTRPTGGKKPTVVDGLKRAALKFTSQELAYDSASNAQKFIVFITTPTGTANSNCAP